MAGDKKLQMAKMMQICKWENLMNNCKLLLLLQVSTKVSSMKQCQ